MDIQQSIDRIHQSQQTIGDLFYDVFLRRHPEVQVYFQGVDMQRQAVLLTMQLSIVAIYYQHRTPAAEMYLRILGTKHNDRRVPREQYPKFREVLLETLEHFHGGDWNPELATQWKTAIDMAAEKMFEGYEQRFHM
jgi:hemoglobin-like flavoprotein